jgi:hypothetical protein
MKLDEARAVVLSDLKAFSEASAADLRKLLNDEQNARAFRERMKLAHQMLTEQKNK